MAPLIKELQVLWWAVVPWDVTKEDGQRQFNLQAIFMWAIHDYPIYGLVVGCVHQGYKACGPHLTSHHFQKLNKVVYEGFRRWLPSNHPYRRNRNPTHFNGKEEHMFKSQLVTTIDTFRMAVEYETWVRVRNTPSSIGDPSKFIGIKCRNVTTYLTFK